VDALGGKTAMDYNELGYVTSVLQKNSGRVQAEYDAMGNLMKETDAMGGVTSYEYNANGLVTKITDALEQSAEMRYDESGNVTEITAPDGSSTKFGYDLSGRLVSETDANGTETLYTYGLERISAQTGNRKTEYVYDGRGSVAAEVSYSNAWYTLGGALSKKDIVSKSYTPFGEQIGEAVSGFGYNGEYYNAATGMIYLRARFYEPEMNRFGQKDILHGNILNIRTLNRYLYVQNDPINYYDPSGEFGLLVGTAIAAGISGLIAGGVSAYQSYKSTGSVNWRAAGKAALGGAVSAVAVGLAVATGGTGLGLFTMAAEAYAGVRTAMRGGDAASVATATARTGSWAYIGGAVSPFIPAPVWAGVGSAGMAISGYRAVGDTRNVISVFNNPYATSLDKLNAVLDLGEDVVGFFGSAKMTVDAFKTIFSGKDFNSLCSRNKASDDADITDPPKVATDDTPDAVQKINNSKDPISSTEGNKSKDNFELKFGGDTKKSTKLSNEMIKRGWSEENVRDTVYDPFTIRQSTNKANGHSATAYYNQDGSYVVIDDITNEVIQVSDRFNINEWIPDSEIQDPYFP